MDELVAACCELVGGTSSTPATCADGAARYGAAGMVPFDSPVEVYLPVAVGCVPGEGALETVWTPACRAGTAWRQTIPAMAKIAGNF